MIRAQRLCSCLSDVYLITVTWACGFYKDQIAIKQCCGFSIWHTDKALRHSRVVREPTSIDKFIVLAPQNKRFLLMLHFNVLDSLWVLFWCDCTRRRCVNKNVILLRIVSKSIYVYIVQIIMCLVNMAISLLVVVYFVYLQELSGTLDSWSFKEVWVIWENVHFYKYWYASHLVWSF